MNEKKVLLDKTFKTAVDLHTKGKINDAGNIYKRILEVNPIIFWL